MKHYQKKKEDYLQNRRKTRASEFTQARSPSNKEPEKIPR